VTMVSLMAVMKVAMKAACSVGQMVLKSVVMRAVKKAA